MPHLNGHLWRLFGAQIWTHICFWNMVFVMDTKWAGPWLSSIPAAHLSLARADRSKGRRHGLDWARGNLSAAQKAGGGRHLTPAPRRSPGALPLLLLFLYSDSFLSTSFWLWWPELNSDQDWPGESFQVLYCQKAVTSLGSSHFCPSLTPNLYLEPVFYISNRLPGDVCAAGR